MKLNFPYYSGQVFDLDQKTVNKLIEDVKTLRDALGTEHALHRVDTCLQDRAALQAMLDDAREQLSNTSVPFLLSQNAELRKQRAALTEELELLRAVAKLDKLASHPNVESSGGTMTDELSLLKDISQCARRLHFDDNELKGYTELLEAVRQHDRWLAGVPVQEPPQEARERQAFREGYQTAVMTLRQALSIAGAPSSLGVEYADWLERRGEWL
jgi:hypothetical protein